MGMPLTLEQEINIQCKLLVHDELTETGCHELFTGDEFKVLSARQLLNLPKSERARILQRQSDRAAKEYRADLA